jgi:hypothetical protein
MQERLKFLILIGKEQYHFCMIIGYSDTTWETAMSLFPKKLTALCQHPHTCDNLRDNTLFGPDYVFLVLLLYFHSSHKSYASFHFSIRAMCGVDSEKNCVHGSDSPQSAAREISFFFGDVRSDTVEHDEL